MAQSKPTTKIEMYDFAWGGFRSMSDMGADESGIFPSAAAADRYTREVVSRSPRRAARVTIEGKPSYVLRNRGNSVASPRIVRTTA